MPYNTLGPPNVSSIVFSKPDVLGAHLSGPDPRCWVSDVGHQPRAPLFAEIPPYCVLPHQRWDFLKTMTLPFLPISMCLSFVVQRSSSSFQTFFRGELFIHSYKFDVSVGRG